MGNDLTTLSGGNGVVPYSNDGIVTTHQGSHSGGGVRVSGSSGDAALFESFGQALTSNGLSGVHQHRAMQAAQRWYEDFVRKSEAQEAAMHERQMSHATIELRRDWGPDYSTNMRLLHGFMDSVPAETKEFLLEARSDDHSALLNHVPFLRRLVDLLRAERINGGHSVSAPSRVQKPAQVASGAESLEEIEQLMRDRNSKYHRGPSAARLQQRYRELLVESGRAQPDE